MRATASEEDAVAFAALLLERGAEPNVRQTGGFIPLHEAALRGNLPLLRRLLDAGADPSLENDAGEVPRELALSHDRPQAAALLAAAELRSRPARDEP